MFEVYHTSCEFPVAKFLYKVDVEIFIEASKKKNIELGNGLYILNKEPLKKMNLFSKIYSGIKRILYTLKVIDQQS